MCSLEVQDCYWWSSSLSGFKGQVLDHQSQAPHKLMLWWRSRWEWQGWSYTECLHLHPVHSSRPTACPVLLSNTHQYWSLVSAQLSKHVQTNVYHVNCSVYIINWVTKSNCPMSIVKDQDLCKLHMAGCPNMKIPSPKTISHDIKVSFDKCQECITKLLQVNQFNVLCIWLIYYCDRNMLDAYTLPLTLGHLWTTGPSLLGWYILSMMEW